MKKFSRSRKQHASGKSPRLILGALILLVCMVLAVIGFFIWNSPGESIDAADENNDETLLTDEDADIDKPKAVFHKIKRKQPSKTRETAASPPAPDESLPAGEPLSSTDQPPEIKQEEPVSSTGQSPKIKQEEPVLESAIKTDPAPSPAKPREEREASPGVAPEKVASLPGGGETLRLSAGAGRVREEPSLSAPIKFLLKQGAAATVKKKEGDWLFIDAGDDRSGWAHQSLFEQMASGETLGAETAKKVKKIMVETARPDEERIIFALNGKHLPKTFSLEGERPRLVSDFFDAALSADVARNIQVDGAYIQRIRIGIHHGETPRVRVVADLSPGRNYDVKQYFFDKSLTFVLVLKSTETATR
ncbi:MAG: hypothetical protein GY859_43205 [Desulfobacterales bacterium]|nr:hypothetical protein [Desulfobacterales bacterium]